MDKPNIRPLLPKQFCTKNAKKPRKCPRLQVKVLALRALQSRAHPVRGRNCSCHLCDDSECSATARLLKEWHSCCCVLWGNEALPKRVSCRVKPHVVAVFLLVLTTSKWDHGVAAIAPGHMQLSQKKKGISDCLFSKHIAGVWYTQEFRCSRIDVLTTAIPECSHIALGCSASRYQLFKLREKSLENTEFSSKPHFSLLQDQWRFPLQWKGEMSISFQYIMLPDSSQRHLCWK